MSNVNANISIAQCIHRRFRRNRFVLKIIGRLYAGGYRTVNSIQRLAFDRTALLSTRVDAITILVASTPSPRVAIQRLIHYPDRKIAFETLKRLKVDPLTWAIPTLIAGSGRAAPPLRREMFAWTLGGYRGVKRVENALLQIATGDRFANVRENAIKALAEFPSLNTSETLIGILKGGAAGERFWALYSLGTTRDSRAYDAIQMCLQDHSEIRGFWRISDEARWALDEIAKKALEQVDDGEHE